MATVETTVRKSILSFPSLYNNRSAVFEFLFTVAGNGCKWVNGELVSDDLDQSNHWTREAALADGEKNLWGDMHPEVAQFIIERFEREYDRYEQIISEVDQRSQGNIAFTWENRRANHLLMNVPADIKPDWAQAVAEAWAAIRG